MIRDMVIERGPMPRLFQCRQRSHRNHWRSLALTLLVLVFVSGGIFPPPSSAQLATPLPAGEAMITAPTAITGTITFPDETPVGPPADITIRLEDVSLADAPAIILASITLDEIPVPPPAGEQITFSLPVASFDPRFTYTVRVHVDRDGDGQVSKGDLVSTTHIPVLTQGRGTEVQVPVEIV
jgi:putative lipoprotein